MGVGYNGGHWDIYPHLPHNSLISPNSFLLYSPQHLSNYIV